MTKAKPKSSTDEWFELARDMCDYMEHHDSNTSEEETALVVRYLDLKLKDGR